MKKLRTSLLAFFILLSGCSTLSNRDKTIVQMAAAGVVGGVIGSITTPEGENPGTHALLWGAVASTAAGVAGLYVNSDERELKERESQILKLRQEVAAFKGEDEPLGTEEAIVSSRTSLESTLPKEYRRLVRPGGWTLFKRDEWVQVSETEMVHQDKRLILNPPSLNFGKKEN